MACRISLSLRCRSGHFLSMCDSTGLLQHAVHSVPDRSHGYCVDDNARALIFACALGSPGEPRLAETLTARFAAFIQHAWNPDTRRFRNFMSYDRRWLEDRARKTATGGRCGRSANARGAIRTRHGGNGPLRSSRRRCRRSRSFDRRGPGRSRCWDWTHIAQRAREIQAVTACRALLADRLMSLLGRGRDSRLGVVRGWACL